VASRLNFDTNPTDWLNAKRSILIVATRQAGLLWKTGKRAEAKQAMEQVLIDRAALLDKSKGTDRYARDLAWSRMTLSEMLIQLDDAPGAKTLLQPAFAVLTELSLRAPTDSRGLESALESGARLAAANLLTNDTEGALQVSLQVNERLAPRVTNTTEHKQSAWLATSEIVAAEALRKAGRPNDAAPKLAEAAKRLRELRINNEESKAAYAEVERVLTLHKLTMPPL
jgi:hypothetical protein